MSMKYRPVAYDCTSVRWAPPISLCIGLPQVLPMMSHSAMSIPLSAEMAMPLLP
ncbi:hypothetical protein D3C72_2070360 [compost metagenome]